MTELVLDASVVLRWFDPLPHPHVGDARRLRDEFATGRLVVVVPTLLFYEVLNVAGRQWRLPGEDLLELVTRLEDARFELDDPELASVAEWVARGLSAYDAAYVALAQERGIALVTDDRQVLAVAEPIARPLASPR